MRHHRRDGGRERLRTRIAAAGLVLAAGGCSADVARFDFPTFSLTEGSGATASAPRPPLAVRNGGAQLAQDAPTPLERTGGGAAQGRGDGEVRLAALPEADPSSLPAAGPSAFDPRRIERRVPAGPPQRGAEIEVLPGDTLYGLSRRHRVSLSELMTVNELADPRLKPGQRIYLPAGRAPARPLESSRPAEVASARHVEESSPRPADSGAWHGTYKVRPGDSIYAVARRHNVSFLELQQVNAITDARKVRPGTVLKVPSAGDPPVTSGRENAPLAPAEFAPPNVPSTTQPTIINGEKRVAALGSMNDASPQPPSEPIAAAPARRDDTPSATGADGRLRWPVSGRIIAAFGPRSDGTHNDGLNLAVPLGTDVHAAEGGLVAYAGNELKGYGNLVLLRHDNGWVTAYAHNDELLVKRGDKVRRGQVLARAGKTGQVDQPQVHFELRQGSKPVDPTPFLERF
jgi:murein DD-endopeptidase MepM/ murein hydrolase activator NlpD